MALRAPAGRIRWDRLARVTLLIVLAVVAGLWVQNGIALISAKRAADRQAGIVRGLQRANQALAAEQRSLQDPAVIQRDARALGMVQSGEHSYVVTGLGRN